MNFSLPKLSAVALLSLAAGFGASLWLNAEPEEPGTAAVEKCKTVYKYDPFVLKAWQFNMGVDEKNGPLKIITTLCVNCVRPTCLQQPNNEQTFTSPVDPIDPTKGKNIVPFNGLATTTPNCTTCTTGWLRYQDVK